jgi:hypothetical protein
MSKYEHPVTVFSEKKNAPINLLYIKPANTFTLGLPLSNSHVTCGFYLLQILQLYLFRTPLTWNVTLSEKRAWQRKSGDLSILSSISTVKFVRATWSLSFSAWIIWILYALRWSLLCSTSCTVERGVCNCKLAAQIGLRLFYNALNIADSRVTNDRMADEWLIGNILEGNACGLIVILHCHLLGEIKENHVEPQSG